jgi:uncharacterized protein
VPHRTPNLSILLERAKDGASADAVKAYLDAGGTPVSLLQYRGAVRGAECLMQVSLLHYMALCNPHPHAELAECVRLLVEAGADINATAGPDEDHRPALICASERWCCTEPLQAYLHNGADVCALNSIGQTALHQAAVVGYISNCEVLLAKENSLAHVRDAYGHTALMLATKIGFLGTVTMLHQHGADINTVNHCGTTPLIAASSKKHIDMVIHLLKAGANVQAVDSKGQTALVAAVHQNSIPIVQLLLNHGADLNAKNTAGQNILFCAVFKGHMFMMELLVKRGLSITAVAFDGTTLLMVAACEGHKAAAEWLIQRGLAVNAADSAGYTALHITCASSVRDDPDMIDLLLASGADVNQYANEGTTALELAAYHGNIKCARALIDAGADVNHANNIGVTSLMRAVVGQHSPIMQLLFDHGAKAVMNSVTDIQGAINGTALMMCTIVDTVQVLLAAGADAHATNDVGDTCLHTAVRHECPVPMICLLIRAGVHLHAVNTDGKTAVDIAHDRGYTLIEQLLLRAAQQQQH